jgi:hypothetical protein
VETGKRYCPLGEVMDQIARNPKRNIRGPYRIAAFVQKRTGGGPQGNTWSDYFHGKASPSAETMRRFVQAFECDAQEVAALAHARTFRKTAAA